MPHYLFVRYKKGKERELTVRTKTVSGILILLIALLMLSIQPPARAQERIVIGWAHPLTGPVAPTAAVHHLYYKMVIDDYNAKGGLNVPGIGMLPIEYIEYDDAYDPAESLRLIEKLITEDQVDFLFAPWSTAFNVAALPLFEEYQYPTIGLTVGSNTLSDLLQTGEYNYFFVTLAQPREDAEELGEVITYINEEYPTQSISRVGITYRADEHGIEHAEAIRDGLTAIGIEVPVYESYPWLPPPADWTPIITMFRDADVDVAILCGYDEGGVFVGQCIAQDYNPKLLVIGPAMETPFLVYDVFGFSPGDMAGIAYYNGFPATTYNTPELQAWTAHHLEYTAANMGFPYLPFPASAVFYAGLEALFKAIEKYGLDRVQIRDALETESFETIVGTFKFRRGLGPEVEGHGTITQWQGGDMMDVIWPPDAATADIIYPKFPWSWAEVSDVLRDGIVDIFDVVKFAGAFGTGPGDYPKFFRGADVNGDKVVDIFDAVAIAKDFGKTV